MEQQAALLAGSMQLHSTRESTKESTGPMLHSEPTTLGNNFAIVGPSEKMSHF